MVTVTLEDGRKVELNGAPAMIVKAVSEFASLLPQGGKYSMDVHVGERDVVLMPQSHFVFREPNH
jgi:hypothetical protein